MKLVKLYEHLLTETAVEACVKQFGKSLFADQLSGNEPNTRTEDNYVDLIKRFTDNEYGESLSGDFMKAAQNLKGCMDTYPEVLIPEKTNIYRGLVIPLDYFINKRQPIDLNNWFDYTYKAPNKIQSWSESLDVAENFGSHDNINEIARNIFFKKLNNLDQNLNTPEGRKKLLQYVYNNDVTVGFVLQYVTNKKDFLFKAKYFSKISEAPAEEEVLRISNNPINVKAKLNSHENVFLSKNGLILIKLINQAISEL